MLVDVAVRTPPTFPEYEIKLLVGVIAGASNTTRTKQTLNDIPKNYIDYTKMAFNIKKTKICSIKILHKNVLFVFLVTYAKNK